MSQAASQQDNSTEQQDTKKFYGHGPSEGTDYEWNPKTNDLTQL